MNLDKLNQWLTLLANFGVIAGIVFLAIQVNQNNQMMKSQTRSEISRSISDMLLSQVSSPYIGVIAGSTPVNEMSEADRFRFQNFQLAEFRIWENIHYQYRKGLYEDSEFTKEKEIWRKNVNQKKNRSIYCQWRFAYSEAFVKEMDSLLTAPCEN